MPSEVGVLGGVRALVLDPDSHVSLAACRALGRAGVVAEVGGDRFAGIAERSRYVRATHALPDARGPAAPYAEALRSLIDTRRIDVVVTTDDATIARLDSIDLPVASVPGLGAARRSLVDKAAGLAEAVCVLRRCLPGDLDRACEERRPRSGRRRAPGGGQGAHVGTATADGVACARGATTVDSVEGGARQDRPAARARVGADRPAPRGKGPQARRCAAATRKRAGARLCPRRAPGVPARGRSRGRRAHRQAGGSRRHPGDRALRSRLHRRGLRGRGPRRAARAWGR